MIDHREMISRRRKLPVIKTKKNRKNHWGIVKIKSVRKGITLLFRQGQLSQVMTNIQKCC
jgi:hypothetical protein